MDLTEYLFKYKINGDDFSHEIDVSGCAVSRIIRGLMSPKLSTALRIYIACDGEIDIGTLLTPKDKKKIKKWRSSRGDVKRKERKADSVLNGSI